MTEKPLQEKVKNVFNEKVRPCVRMDGVDATFEGLKGPDVALVKIEGNGTDCPETAVSIKEGMERILLENVPQIREIVLV